MELVSTLAVAFWLMLPAYVPNNVAVLVGGGRPIDGGRTLGERRVLGDGKTWRGTFAGTLAGMVLALSLSAVSGVVGDGVAVTLPTFPLVVAFSLSFGAMLGDMTASFLKRRLGRKRGAAFPGLDQLDFVIGALGLTAVVAPAWFGESFTLPVLAAIAVVTPLLHVGTNGIAYALDLKQEPW
jgi:CDP-2,3-bis-(O-geranylgeranyl)-sn-glycerol synthase